MALSKSIKVNLIFLNGIFLLLHIIVTLRHYCTLLWHWDINKS